MPVIFRKTDRKKEQKQAQKYQWFLQIGVVLLISYVIGKDYFLSRSEAIKNCQSELAELKPNKIKNPKPTPIIQEQPNDNKLFDIVTTKKSKSKDLRGAICGDELMVHLILVREDSETIFNTTNQNSPLKIVLGEGKMQGLEHGLEGIKIGEQRQIVIPNSMMIGTMIKENQKIQEAYEEGDLKIGAIAELIKITNNDESTNKQKIVKLVFKEGNGKKLKCGDIAQIAYIPQNIKGDTLSKASQDITFQFGTSNLPSNFIDLINSMTEEEEILAFTSNLKDEDNTLKLPEDASLLQLKLLKINP